MRTLGRRLAAWACLSLIGAVSAGCAAQVPPMAGAADLDLAHFKSAMEIKDDALETAATFSTAGGYRQTRGLLGIVWEDEFLRGFIQKATGTRSYQVYVALMHQGDTWLHPFQANFGEPLRTEATTSVHTDVTCAKNAGCTYVEHSVFAVSEPELRRAVSGPPDDRNPKIWRFRLKTKAGRDYDGGLPRAEIAALLDVMDAYPVAVAKK